MKKLVATGLVAAGIAGGSVAVAALAPFGVAGAQDEGSTTTVPSTEAPSTGAPRSEDSSAAPRRHRVLAEALESLVEDGTITQAQSDAIAGRVEEKASELREQLGDRKQRHDAVGHLGARPERVAEVLGITVDDLRAQLGEGKTLAEIAGDRRDALVQALVDDANARIDRAVADGKLTAERAAELKENTAARIARLVDSGGTPHRGHVRPGRRGMR